MARQQRRDTRAYRWFHDLLRIVLGPIMVWTYRLRAENLELFQTIRAPYFVIPNHVMTWDPLLVSYYVRDPIHFVASDANFRSSFASWWLRRVGAIAKSKLMDDFATLRTVMALLKEGKVVGLFAEGQRTWDGSTLPIIPSTAKLVKLAKVPVVVPVIKGGYMALPRWAFRTRRGRVVIEYRLALTAREAATMSVDAITRRIEEVMRHNEDEYQAQARQPYLNSHGAEPLQLLLFTCPTCSSLNRMKSRGRRFYCTACGYSVRFSAYGRFRPDPHHYEGPVVYDTISEWVRGQEHYLDGHLSELSAREVSGAVFADERVLFSTGYRMSRPAAQGLGRLMLHIDDLRFVMDGREEMIFPWSEIRALNVVYQDQIEFYFRKRLCVFQFPDHDTSGYKYLLCGEKLARLSGTSALPS